MTSLSFDVGKENKLSGLEFPASLGLNRHAWLGASTTVVLGMALVSDPHELIGEGNKSAGSKVARSMRHQSRAIPSRGIDWKAVGYTVSILSVFFLGAIAWPKPADPAWHLPALIVGMASSIVGMGVRYKTHRDEQREIRHAEAEAERAMR